MKWEVKLYVGGTVFEDRYADYDIDVKEKTCKKSKSK